LFSELRNTSGNGVPSQWITRSVVRRVKKKKNEEEEEENEEEEEEEIAVEEGSENEATDRDYWRREEKK